MIIKKVFKIKFFQNELTRVIMKAKTNKFKRYW